MAAEIVNLFEINIDTEQAAKDTERMRKAVLELKKGLKELTDEEKLNNDSIKEQLELLRKLESAENKDIKLISETNAKLDELFSTRDDLNESIVDQTKILKVNSKELSENERFIQQSVLAQTRAEGSIEQLQAKLAVATIQWKRLSKEERENTDAGKLLTKQKKELTEELKKEEKATGDARRNVGNYTESILEALSTLKKQKEAQEKSIEVLKRASKASGATKEQQKAYKEELKQTELALKSTNKELNKFDSSNSDISDSLSSLSSGFGGVKDGVGSLGKSLKALLANPVVLVLAAIVGTLKLLYDAFAKSQGGADKLNKITAILSAVFEAFQGILVQVAEFLIGVFENPKKSLSEFATSLKENIINRFTGLLELIPALGEAIGKMFKGDFSGAAKVATDATAKIVLGVENFTDKVQESAEVATKAFNEITSAINKSVDAAIVLQKLQVEFDEANIKATTALAKLNAEAELQNAIADDSTKTFKEKLAAAELASIATEKAANLEIDLATKELAIIQKRNDQLKGNNQLLRENRQQEADLVANVIQLQSQLVLKRQENSKRIGEINRDEFEQNLDYLVDNFDNVKTLNEKIISNDKELFETRKALLNETRRLGTKSFNEQIEEYQKITENGIDANDLLNESDSKRFLEKSRLLGLDEIESQRLLQVIRDRRTVLSDLAEIEVSLHQETIDKKTESNLLDAEKQKEIEAANLEYKKSVENANIAERFDTQRLELEAKEAQELEFAERIGMSTTEIAQRYSTAKKAIDKAEFDAKINLATGFLDNIATIAGEGTAIGKAAAVASTTIATYQSATAAFSSFAGLGPAGVVAGIAAAGAAVASGIANVKKILAVDTGLPSSGGGGGSAPSVSVPRGTNLKSLRADTVADVNSGIVSRQNPNTNNENTQPLQPTLVIDSVTSAQNQQFSNNNTSTL